MVVDAGSVTNFMTISAGASINITNYTTAVLSNAFANNLANLNWSVFSGFPTLSTWVTPVGNFPKGTTWYTQARTNTSVQSTPPGRNSVSGSVALGGQMTGVGGNQGASAISAQFSAGPTNTTQLVVEPIGYAAQNWTLTSYIGDALAGNTALGDFDESAFTYSVENITPASFTSAQVSDFYLSVPKTLTDPITLTTTGNADYLGYFTLNPNGSMTFTRAGGSPAAPVAGFTGTPTNGYTSLKVVFTDASTGSITNWVWSFGDGNGITNTSTGNVTNTYSSAGNYTVSLTVNGPGGSNTNKLNNYIVVSNLPPVASFTGIPTNGFASLTVVFTNTSTGGSFTNSVWDFGNGTRVTNITSGNVTNTYAVASTNTVTLTVNGVGGSSTNKLTSYIAAFPPSPKLTVNTLSAGKLLLSCSNSPVGVQYRILSSTNIALPMANWIPVWTNTFPNPYTNNSTTNSQWFLRLVSP